MYEQLKKAHEDYDKLDSEFKQMANNYDMIKFLNEDLKNEITEREEEIKRTNFQVYFRENNELILFLGECIEGRVG